ncbi:hypothetical protein QL285_023469 [Trifolium repens]|nr:hypothetical protein QL285_023469 [Trifolium repens]
MAACNGIIEIVEVIIHFHLRSIEHVSEDEQNILYMAVKHRQLQIFRMLKKLKIDARYCKVDPAGKSLFEVYDGFTRFPVNLNSHTCECKSWQISGMPCKHSAAAIIYIRARVEDYCDTYYSKEKYITTYSSLVSPLPDPNTLEEEDVLPPPLRRLPGRPKKNRRREKDEDVAPSNARKLLSTIKCTNCGTLGHNKRSCQRAPTKAKKTKQGGSVNASQSSTRKEIPHGSTQERVKSQMLAKLLKRSIREGRVYRNPSSILETQESIFVDMGPNSDGMSSRGVKMDGLDGFGLDC